MFMSLVNEAFVRKVLSFEFQGSTKRRRSRLECQLIMFCVKKFYKKSSNVPVPLIPASRSRNLSPHMSNHLSCNVSLKTWFRTLHSHTLRSSMKLKAKRWHTSMRNIINWNAMPLIWFFKVLQMSRLKRGHRTYGNNFLND